MKTKSNAEVPWPPVSLPPEIIVGILDNRYEGVTIVDHEGVIIFTSQSTERFFGLDYGGGVGKHVTEIFPGSTLHRVARSGKAEIGVTVEVRGEKKIVSRIPILNEGRIVGAVSKIMFKDVDSLVRASTKASHLIEAVSDSSRYAQHVESGRFAIENVVGESPQTIALRKFVQMAARTSSTVLITGETGSGKEVVAQAIHNLSPRSAHPFISINCAAIPRDLFESELFGYAPGAFTGAARNGKIGLVTLAHKGTLFLDEITELPLEMQPKLLRVLQEREFYPVGSREKMGTNFRLICASNRDMEDMVAKGLFRQDLFFRLNVLDVRIPPLRERTEDIPDLCYYLLSRLKKNMETRVEKISSEVMTIFQQHAWKGNVRELDNVLERALNVAPGDVIELEHLPRSLLCGLPEKRSAASGGAKLRKQREEAEKACILEALQRSHGNRTAAAKSLGLHRTHLYKKMKKYGLDVSACR